MKFHVDDVVFDKLPDVCFAVVIAKGIDNSISIDEVSSVLEENAKNCENEFAGLKVKESEAVKCYRDAFTTLAINPNKFMCSIEALLTRIAKGKGMPSINAAVDIANSISLKYKLAIGAHDIGSAEGDFEVRAARESDSFIPFGSAEKEPVDLGEIVYASGDTVRTRRWIWRQSELGKITTATKDIFFPIDGFKSVNEQALLLARNELAEQLKNRFNCEVLVGFVDSENRSFEF